MEWFLIIVTIVMAILLLFVNFYLLVLYCHRKLIKIYNLADDKGWGASLFCKILVIFGMTLTWA